MLKVFDFSFLVFCAEVCRGTGVIELTLLSFDNPKGTISSNTCCDSPGATTCPANECDPSFVMCVQDLRHDTCELGNTSTSSFDNVDFIDFTAGPTTLTPIRFPFASYPGSLILQISVLDTNTGQSDEKIDYYQYLYSDKPDPNGTITNSLHRNMTGKLSRLDMVLNVRCDVNFYGDDCTKYCAPDVYRTCTAGGDEICLSGPKCPTVSIPSLTTTTTVKITSAPSTSIVTSSSVTFSSTNVISQETTSFATAGTLSSTSASSSPSVTSSSSTNVMPVTITDGNGGFVTNVSLPTNLTDISTLQTRLGETVGQLIGISDTDIDVNITSLHQHGLVSELVISATYRGNHSIIDSSIVKRGLRNVMQPSTAPVTNSSTSTSFIPGIVGGAVGAAVLGGLGTLLVYLLLKRKNSKIHEDPKGEKSNTEAT